MVRCRARQSAARHAGTSPRWLTLDRSVSCAVVSRPTMRTTGTSSNRPANHHNCPEFAMESDAREKKKKPTPAIAIRHGTSRSRSLPRDRRATPTTARCPPPRPAAHVVSARRPARRPRGRRRLCQSRFVVRVSGHPPPPATAERGAPGNCERKRLA